MNYSTIITLVLFGILWIHWSTAALSTGICIDRISSFIISSCNGCIRVNLPSRRYSDFNTRRALDAKELLHVVAKKCCHKRCSMPYLRSFCCNTRN
ncbi:hypothetical protein ACH3XW_35825 [Acanthocheilonema viteae]